MSFFKENALPGPRRSGIFFLVLVLVLGCDSKHSLRKPSIQVTRVPSASPGGPEQLDYIEGHVSDAGSGQEIVLYAYSGNTWWVQPFTNRSSTKIQADANWKNLTHLGTDYAALLVQPGYHPELKLTTLPKEGNGVVAVVSVKGNTASPIITKVIHFSGYDWIVRTAGSDRGGEPNSYDPNNVWLDQKGYLHLRMAMRDGKWSCAEARLTRSLGYGTYRFVVHDGSQLGPSVVLAMYTWDEGRADGARAELDLELSRWGKPGNKNAQYVVQPYYVPENVYRFMTPGGVMTHLFRWEAGNASFKTLRGADLGNGSKAISEHVFNSGIPIPAAESVHIELYDFHHSKSSSQRPAEVVIEKFEYLP